MGNMKCDKNCLNCSLEKCVHDIEDRMAYIKDFERKKDRIRHKKYYLEHKEEIDAKQKEYDAKNRNTETQHRYWEKHKDELKAKHKLRYQQDRANRLKKAKEYYELNKDEINRRRREKRRKEKEA